MWKFKTSIRNRNKKIKKITWTTCAHIYVCISLIFTCKYAIFFLIYYYYFLLICWIIEGCYCELWVIEDQCKRIRICNCLQRFSIYCYFFNSFIHSHLHSLYIYHLKMKQLYLMRYFIENKLEGVSRVDIENMTWANNSMTIEIPKIANDITQSIIRR